MRHTFPGESPTTLILRHPAIPGIPELRPISAGSSETLVTVEFFARGNSTEVVLTHATFGTAKDRDDHNRGWNGCFDILARVIQTTSRPS